MTGEWGPLVTAVEVQEAVEAVLVRWLVPWLAEIERRHNLPARSIPAPKNYRHAAAFGEVREDQLPSIVIVSGGLAGPPELTDSGVYRFPWDVAVFAAVRDPARQRGRGLEHVGHMRSRYTAAIAAALGQNPTLEGFCTDSVLGQVEHDVIGVAASAQTVAAGVVPITVFVDEALDVTARPADPPADPYAVPPDPIPIDRLTVEVEPIHPANE